MKEGDKWNIAFNMKDGLIEWLVMPFILTNAPNTFMRLRNSILNPFLGKFMVVYLDDIFIFSISKAEHVENVRVMLHHLKEEKLLINLKKCTFMQ